MKTVNLKAFANEKIQEGEMNFLKGGAKGDPVEDIIVPPRK